jgi:ElaB/YqjD/DUF883 family membrane-anchored ribosome-binding protein
MSENKIEKLEERIRQLENDLDEMVEENAKMAKLARAVCEIQEELVRNNPTIYIVNKINAPTRVGMQ